MTHTELVNLAYRWVLRLERLNKALGMLAPRGYWFANLLEGIYHARTVDEAVALAKEARIHIDKSLAHGPMSEEEIQRIGLEKHPVEMFQPNADGKYDFPAVPAMDVNSDLREEFKSGLRYARDHFGSSSVGVEEIMEVAGKWIARHGSIIPLSLHGELLDDLESRLTTLLGQPSGNPGELGQPFEKVEELGDHVAGKMVDGDALQSQGPRSTLQSSAEDGERISAPIAIAPTHKPLLHELAEALQAYRVAQQRILDHGFANKSDPEFDPLWAALHACRKAGADAYIKYRRFVRTVQPPPTP